MALPTSRNETAAPGSQVKSETTNDLQDYTVDCYHKFSGGDVYISDEFTGDSINRGMWTNPTAGVTVGNGGGFLDSGDATFTGTAGNPGPSIVTGGIKISTRDFHMAALARYTTANTGATFYIGLDDGAAGGAYFTSTNGNWFARYTGDGGTGHNTAVAPSSTAQFLEIYRSGGTAYWYINGTQVHSVALATDLYVSLKVLVTRTSADATLLVDKIHLTASRGRTTAAVPAL